MPDYVRRAIRTAIQLVASGALTALVDKIVGGMSPEAAGMVLAIWQIVVAFAHNALEDTGAIPALLKAPASSGEHPVPADGQL